MANWLGSLSIEQAVWLVLLCSTFLVLLVVFFTARLGHHARRALWLRRLCAVGLPFGVAYCVYWWPAWSSGSDLAQYGAWERLGVGVPFVPALLVSLVIVLVAERRQSRAAGN